MGQALGKNPFAIIVPCHRVVGGSGKAVGVTAEGEVDAKRRILMMDRRSMRQSGPLFAASHDDNIEEALEHLRRKDATLRKRIDEVDPFSMQIKSTSQECRQLLSMAGDQAWLTCQAATLWRL